MKPINSPLVIVLVLHTNITKISENIVIEPVHENSNNVAF